MSDYTIDTPATLGDFLINKESLQPWRLPLLVKAAAITVTRGPAALINLTSTTQLLAGDKVSLQDPLPALTPAAADFLDYCFVPGSGSPLSVLQSIMDNRPQSKRLTSLTALEEFIDALSSKEITNPIRYLYIGSHANDSGDLFMQMQTSSSTTAPIEYEDLEAAEKSNIIKIDPKLVDPRPQVSGQAVPPQFRIRGCRIGKAKPFLDQLKKALGGNMTVNAPKHFEHVGTWSQPDGPFEYMDYDFQIRKAKPFKTTAETVAAYLAAGFTDIDGKPIAPALIRAGIPANVKKQGEQSKDTTVQAPFVGKPYKTPISFRYHNEQFRIGMSSFPLSVDPIKQVLRIAELKNQFTTDPANWPLFDSKHAFPEWIRLGYADLDELLAGFTWKFQYDKTNKTMSFNGDRHVYDVLIPITDSGTTNLICNFYPTTTGTAVYEKMDAADMRLYETS